jgi:biopolymer transport protein ExbB/TolQ
VETIETRRRVTSVYDKPEEATMMEYIREGGIMMYPLIGIAIVIVIMAVRSWMRISGKAGNDAVVETGIDAVLFWGSYGVVLGILGTLVGIAQAATAIQAVGTVTAALVWGGIKVALNTTIFSLVVFSIAFVVWFSLRVRYRRSAIA